MIQAQALTQEDEMAGTLITIAVIIIMIGRIGSKAGWFKSKGREISDNVRETRRLLSESGRRR